MSNYPDGSIASLMSIERLDDQYDKAYAQAESFFRDELRGAAKEGRLVSWPVAFHEMKQADPAALIAENLPEDTMKYAIRAWLAGQNLEATYLVKAAFHVAFNSAVDFLATQDAENGSEA